MVSRLDVADLAEELSRLYGDVEEQLARGIARRVAAGIDAPDWQLRKLAATGEVRRWVQRLMRGISGKARRAVIKAIAEAFARGGKAAELELSGKRGRGAIGSVSQSLPGASNINALAAGLAGKLDDTGLQVARAVVDAYRQVVSAGAANVLAGTQTRREAAQIVWNRLLDQGFTGFVDARGRKWSLSGYVEMATRTATAQAAVQGQLDRAAQLGIDLVIVSNAPQECVRCRPWEGKVLTRDERGRGGATIRAEHATDDREVSVHVAGSVSEAVAAGLMHPNCRHSLSSYLPGLTVAPTHTADPQGDEARQRLRALERQVRTARLKEAGALTPEAAARARKLAAEAQAKIKAHVAQHDLTRRRDREQLDLGNRRGV